ncbi:MAG TPA: prepilin-type N-terminal cleavage/methylation domain-containing protein [Mycobacteriales bacterium]|nr:prepilin-type N-terminal cleavage/methylation domain-containing protein [Mycobacteriales bacterium]
MIRRLEQRRHSTLPSAGFTLVEVIAALVVFALGALAVVGALTMTGKLSRTNRQRVQAATIAQQRVDLVREQVKNSVTDPIGRTITTTTVGSTTYTITQDTNWTSLGQAGNDCATGALQGSVAYQRVAVSVTWPGGTAPVTDDTVVTPPANVLSADTITLPIQLVTGSLGPLADQTVKVTPVAGGATVSEETDSYGCAVFAQLAPGLYKVEVNTAGYVDVSGVTDHVEQDGQSQPGIVPVVRILYDQPASLTVMPSCTGPAVCSFSAYPPAPSGFKYTVLQTGWPGGSATVVGNGGSPVTKSPVFPFTGTTGGSYNGFAGTCTDANKSNTVATSSQPAPGGTGTITIPLASATFVFSRSGTPVTMTNATITASDTSGGCTDTYTWTGKTINGSLGVALSIPYGSFSWSLKSGSTTHAATTATSVTPTMGATKTVTLSS